MALLVPADLPNDVFVRTGLLSIDGNMFQGQSHISTATLLGEIDFLKKNLHSNDLQTRSGLLQVRALCILWAYSLRTGADNHATVQYLESVGFADIRLPEHMPGIFAVLRNEFDRSPLEITPPAHWIVSRPPPGRLPRILGEQIMQISSNNASRDERMSIYRLIGVGGDAEDSITAVVRKRKRSGEHTTVDSGATLATKPVSTIVSLPSPPTSASSSSESNSSQSAENSKNPTTQSLSPKPPTIQTKAETETSVHDTTRDSTYNFQPHAQFYRDYQFECPFRCVKNSNRHCRKGPVREINRHLHSRHGYTVGFKVSGVDWKHKVWRGAGCAYPEVISRIVRKDSAAVDVDSDADDDDDDDETEDDVDTGGREKGECGQRP